MKLDKYGDPIVTDIPEVDRKTKRAFLAMTLLQFLFSIINVLILVLHFPGYLAFAVAPAYIFIFVHFLNGYSHGKDLGSLPKYLGAVRIISPILYGVTAVIVMLTAFS